MAETRAHPFAAKIMTLEGEHFFRLISQLKEAAPAVRALIDGDSYSEEAVDRFSALLALKETLRKDSVPASAQLGFGR